MNTEQYRQLKRFCAEQHIIENYQKNRVLSRPKTRKYEVVLLAVFFFISVLALIFAVVVIPVEIAIKVSVGLTISAIWCEFYLKFLGKKVTECYQHYAKEETRRRCLCVPSCSEYAIICFEKYEFFTALKKIRRRLRVTCTGDEYKIDFPYRKGKITWIKM